MTNTAVFFTIQLLGVKKKSVIALITGIMVTNITYISQIATYVYEFDYNALALLLAVLAIYLWRKGGSWTGLIGGVLCLLISISIYQAYFAVALTLMIWLILTDLFDERSVKATLRRGATGLEMLILALLLYFVMGKVIYAATGIEPQARVDVFQAGNMDEFNANRSFQNMPSLIYDAANNVWKKVHAYDTTAVYRNDELGEETITSCDISSKYASGYSRTFHWW